VAPSTASLTVGQTCIDAGYHLLGECQASYCDLFGTKHCEPRRADGETCMGAEECVSGSCQSVCTPNQLCTAAN